MEGTEYDPAEKARSAILELVVACKALPDFDTLQIVRFPAFQPCSMCWPVLGEYCNHVPPTEQRGQILEGRHPEEWAKHLGGWAIDCLRKPKMGRREGEGRRHTSRVIEFGQGRLSVKVEECEV